MSAPSKQSNRSDSLVITCGADENYAMPLAVTLHSMLTNLESERTADLFILDGHLQAQHKRRLERVVETASSSTNLRWIRPDLSRLERLPGPEWFNQSIYLRLLLPEVLPADRSRAVYLDSDVQVETDISRLWDTDLEGHPVAATRDYSIPYVSSPLGINHYDELGYSADTPYFNSGVLLLNLDHWRRQTLSNRILQYIRKHREHIQFPDQEGLNAILAANWKSLDLKWNVMSHLIKFEEWNDSPFTARVRSRREELLNDPYIYHFAGSSKPWHVGCNHPAQLRWIGHLWKSGWFSPLERAHWFGKWFARYGWWQCEERVGMT